MIHLYKDYYLNSDSYSFLIEKKHFSKKGEEYFTIEGYYSYIEQALYALVSKVIREKVQEVDSLSELLDETKKIREIIAKEMDTADGIKEIQGVK